MLRLQVLEFMQRKRAEVAERLQRESEAVRAPVLRRMEARRAAASVEQEQVSVIALTEKALRCGQQHKSLQSILLSSKLDDGLGCFIISFCRCT